MNYAKILFVSLLVVATSLIAQDKVDVKKIAEEQNLQNQSYPVDAQPLLQRFYKLNGIDPTQYKIPHNVLRKTTAWNFHVGDQKTFYIPDLESGSTYSVSFTCRAVGVNCYIFVEDTSWTKYVDQNAVDSVRIAFDSKTPSGSINSNKGIYQNDVDTFGTPPDVDTDPRIIILILNIRDGYNGKGGYTAGFFSFGNETGTLGNTPAEIYHLDCYPQNLTKSYYLAQGMSTTAHEFQHMIHWNYKHGSDIGFFDEGCSLVAEVLNGYPLYAQSSLYNQETNHYLLDWRFTDKTNVYKDYSRAARFFLYLKEQFYSINKNFFKTYVQAPVKEVNAMDAYALPAVPTSRRFDNIVVDWWIANYLNDKTVDAKWGYDYPGIPKVTTTTITNPNQSNYSSAVYKQAVQYFSYTSGKNLNFTTNTNGNVDVRFKAIEEGTSGKRVIDITPNSTVSMPEFGNPYSTITFMVYHNNSNIFSTGPFSYTFNSTGANVHTVQELSNDQNQEPVGVWAGTVGDTVAVSFAGVSGATLDSIKVALRQAGSVNGGIFQYNSTWSPSPLKKSTLVPFTVTSTISPRPQVPYPIPWPNWVKVDLRSNNIDASKDFAIAFYIQGIYNSDGSGANGVLYTLLNGQNFSGSMTFDNQPSTGLPRWLWYVNNSNQTYAYLARAYVSYGGVSDVKQVVELIPVSYKLDQNYPNPFNPSTVISYQLPKGSHVSLKIYDVLGKEVTTLVDEYQNAGAHNAQFSIRNSQLSSGVYFYRLVAVDPSQGSGQSFVQTKKMILMK